MVKFLLLSKGGSLRLRSTRLDALVQAPLLQLAVYSLFISIEPRLLPQGFRPRVFCAFDGLITLEHAEHEGLAEGLVHIFVILLLIVGQVVADR